MFIETQKWKNRLDFLTLISWILISFVFALTSWMWYGVDFRGYYAAATVFVNGGNPYDYHQVAQVLLSVTGSMGNNPYFYSPWFIWFFVPIVRFSFQTARMIWMVFNLVAWCLSLWKFSELLNWPQKGWRRYLVFILSTFTFAWITWIFEQASILVFALLVALIYSIRAQKWVRTGLLLSFLLIKPNVTLVVVAAICLWLILNGHWKPIKVLCITFFILLTISTILTPNWYQPFFNPGFAQGLSVSMDGFDQTGQLRINTTIFDWLTTLGISGMTSWFIYSICAISGSILLFWTIKNSKSLINVISVALLVSFLLTPYALQYDYAPLVIVLFWALSCSNSSNKTRYASYLLAGFVFSERLWNQGLAWGFWIVIGLIALQIWAFFQTSPKFLSLRSD